MFHTICMELMKFLGFRCFVKRALGGGIKIYHSVVGNDRKIRTVMR